MTIEIPNPPDVPNRQKTRIECVADWRAAGGVTKLDDKEIISTYFLGNRAVSGGLELLAAGSEFFATALPFYDFELTELPKSDHILMMARHSTGMYGLYRQNDKNYIRLFDREMASFMALYGNNLLLVIESLYGTSKEGRDKVEKIS